MAWARFPSCPLAVQARRCGRHPACIADLPSTLTNRTAGTRPVTCASRHSDLLIADLPVGNLPVADLPVAGDWRTHGTRALTTGTIHTAYPRGSRMLAII